MTKKQTPLQRDVAFHLDATFPDETEGVRFLRRLVREAVNIYRSRAEADRWRPWWRDHGYECAIVHFVPAPTTKKRKAKKR